MKLFKVRTRLLLSIAVGLLAVLIYIKIAEIKPFRVIGFSNFLKAFYISARIVETFLFFAAISLAVTSAIALLIKQRSRQVIVTLIVGLTIAVMVAIPDLIIRQRINLFKKINDKSLEQSEVVELYRKTSKRGNTKALAIIAVHPNLPDSLQESLSYLGEVEVRRSIAWDCDSEKILERLSNDGAWEVRMAVAMNKNTSLNILKKLQVDSNEDVRNTADSMMRQRD